MREFIFSICEMKMSLEGSKMGQKRWIIVVIVGYVVIVLGIVCYTKRNGREKISFKNDSYMVEAYIPRSWAYQRMKPWDGFGNDFNKLGIEIFVENQVGATISIFTQDGKISCPEDEENQESITTKQGLSGTRYTKESESEVTGFIVFEDGMCAMEYQIDKEIYEKNEKEIKTVIDSIKIKARK